jgi:beta-glucanase (GH16 family)
VRRWTAAAVPVATLAALVATLSGAGASSASGAEPRPTVVQRADFDRATAGWHVDPGLTLSRTPGFESVGAARIRSVAGPRKAVLRAPVSAVQRVRRGAVYRATALLRTSAPGTRVALRLTERADARVDGRVLSTVVLADRTWRKVTVRYKAKTSSDALRVVAIAWNLPAARTFDVDNLRVVRLPRQGQRIAAAGTTPAPSTSAPAPAPAPVPSAPANWRLAWSDEFNGSAVDGSKWRVRNGDHNANELSCLTSRPQNVAVSGGVLHIVAQREQYTCGGYTSSWTSGYLDTIGKMSRTYGRFEMRAKLPTQADASKGLWPAFWLRPDDGGDGEIDIMEAIGSGPGEKNYNSVSQTLWADYNNTYPRQANGVTFPAGGTMSDKFHTYAVEWEPGVIRFLVDDTVTYTRTRSDIPWIDKSFGRNFNIRLNMQVGGSWPGTPTASTQFPADYQVDWVRVYQR